MNKKTLEEIERWLRTSIEMSGEKPLASWVTVGATNTDTAMVKAYHAGIRDILIKLLKRLEMDTYLVGDVTGELKELHPELWASV